MTTVTMRGFGKWGRFGNQLFQYAFLKPYTARRGAQLQLPPWVGNDLFGLKDPPVSVQLPTFKEQTERPGPYSQATPPEGDELLDHDFEGYAQYRTNRYASDKEWIRNLFFPRADIWKSLQPASVRLLEGAGTVIGLHLRRGDYGRLIFYITPVEWYLKWLAEHWDRFPPPRRLFIAAEDRSLIDAFRKYRPQTAESLGAVMHRRPMPHYNYLRHDLKARETHQLDFYPDFWLLSCCHVLVIPNSTFSVAAAMLSPELRELHRSSLPAAGFVREDPWDMFPCQHDRVEDYPHLPGIRLSRNPWW